MKTETVKGFNDYTGDEARKRAKVRTIFQNIFEKYGFEPAETPAIEYEEFVKGDNANDDTVRDVFKLEDRGGRKLALKYELTFPLKRIMKNKKLPYKRYQIDYVFRDEPIKKGRTRQFVQCDVDVVGCKEDLDGAEVLSVVREVFASLKIPITIYINNRRLLNEILEKECVNKKDVKAVIREIDKLDKLPEAEVKINLKKYGAEKIINIFKKPEKDFEKYESYREIKDLKKACKNYGVKVEFKPSLARGLAYYNGNIFEVWSKKLNVSLAGGGAFMFNDVQSIGIAFGFEPINLIADVDVDRVKTIVISINQPKEAIKLTQQLREKGISCTLSTAKPSKALEYANSKGIEQAIFVGEKEVKAGKFKVKNMETGKESALKI